MKAWKVWYTRLTLEGRRQRSSRITYGEDADGVLAALKGYEDIHIEWYWG